jgi:hypothetical protein
MQHMKAARGEHHQDEFENDPDELNLQMSTALS